MKLIWIFSITGIAFGLSLKDNIQKPVTEQSNESCINSPRWDAACDTFKEYDMCVYPDIYENCCGTCSGHSKRAEEEKKLLNLFQRYLQRRTESSMNN